MSLLSRHLPFAHSTTPVQGATYLLGVSLFSIAFLVFLNSAISFVITARLDIDSGVGNIVGTLGFADELVALVACPLWGVVSDRVGVRWVCVVGYAVVAVGLVGVVMARDVYPQLLAARMVFSVGGAATATMVTAILPAVTGPGRGDRRDRRSSSTPQDTLTTIAVVVEREDSHSSSTTPLLPPAPATQTHNSRASTPPRMAGLVGLFTGCGALVALTLFLPLPAQFAEFEGVTQAQAVAYAFYTVATIALIVGAACFLGLRGLRGDEGKGWRMLLGRSAYDLTASDETTTTTTRDEAPILAPASPLLPYHRLLLSATRLGFSDSRIGLAYLGGFVARASSVAISLFIPLAINAYFMGHGFCRGSPNDTSPELKDECRAAYVLSAQLTGTSQLVALLCAPLFGILSDRYRKFNAPLIGAAGVGVVAYVAFARLESPEIGDVEGRGGGKGVLSIVALIGVSQIGAIVCSLGLLGRGVQGDEGGYTLSAQLADEYQARRVERGTDTPDPVGLVSEQADREGWEDRGHLKGSIAGVYSLSGGAAILLLTKLGGYLFDEVSTGAPFYMMAVFNAVLLVVGIGTAGYGELAKLRQRKRVELL